MSVLQEVTGVIEGIPRGMGDQRVSAPAPVAGEHVVGESPDECTGSEVALIAAK